MMSLVKKLLAIAKSNSDLRPGERDTCRMAAAALIGATDWEHLERKMQENMRLAKENWEND